MNMDNQIKLDTVERSSRNRDIVYYNEVANDEINLGDLIRNLIREWKTMAVVMVIGVISAIAIALYQPKVYLVETSLRIPGVSEMGDLQEQNILKITPVMALRRFVDQLRAADILEETLERSSWSKELPANSALDVSQKIKGLINQLSVAVVRHDFYELEKGEKAPFKEINVSLQSTEPKIAAEFLRLLIKNAQDGALVSFSNDISRIKNTRVSKIREQLRSLTLAAKQSRQAEISRLKEANQESIARLKQQIDLKIRQAIQDRENRIVQLSEALKIATELEIREPVIWDDLRPLRKSTQITNEIGDNDSSAPLYFRGTRLLNAELVQLKERKDDKPFIVGLTELEKQILEFQDDQKIVALMSRENDMIYVEKYDDLQRQLSDLLEQQAQFENSQTAIVTQPALVPTRPMGSFRRIILGGVLLSGFLALMVALIRVSMRNSNLRQNERPLVDQ